MGTEVSGASMGVSAFLPLPLPLPFPLPGVVAFFPFCCSGRNVSETSPSSALLSSDAGVVVAFIWPAAFFGTFWGGCGSSSSLSGVWEASFAGTGGAFVDLGLALDGPASDCIGFAPPQDIAASTATTGGFLDTAFALPPEAAAAAADGTDIAFDDRKVASVGTSLIRLFSGVEGAGGSGSGGGGGGAGAGAGGGDRATCFGNTEGCEGAWR